jgi:hypothetical protein
VAYSKGCSFDAEKDPVQRDGIVNAKNAHTMAPLKPQQNGRNIDLVQWMGLILLISFTYRHFGPEACTPITPSVIAIFGAAVVLLLGPLTLKFKG